MKWNSYFVFVSLVLMGCNLPIYESLDDFVPDYDCQNLTNLGFVDKPVWVCLEPMADSISDALILKQNYLTEVDSAWVVSDINYDLFLPVSNSIPDLDSANVSYFHGDRTLLIRSGKDTAWAIVIGQSNRIYNRYGEDTLWYTPTVSKIDIRQSLLSFSSGEEIFGNLKKVKGSLYLWKYRISGIDQQFEKDYEISDTTYANPIVGYYDEKTEIIYSQYKGCYWTPSSF